MVRTLKSIIKDLAQNAVMIAEEEFGSGKKKKKKQTAIEYIVKNLPFSEPIKRIISFLFSKLIDELVETAVEWLHRQKEIQGE